MHILITDSGVGGLSVCAYAERFIRLRGFAEPVKLTFANAAPENDYGYNSMKTRGEKIETFDRFLRSVTERFAPDSIYVACNTLTVLLPDTPYAATSSIPIRGIVNTGVDLLRRELEADAERVAIVFGTRTTIDAGTYPRMLQQQGIAAERVASQACPGLADTISEDREGFRTREEIREWVRTAIERLPDARRAVVACLACTHYGYRKELFAAAFEEAGVHAIVVNPNESAVDDIFEPNATKETNANNRDVDVQFVTRYAIPDATIETLTWFLGDISPKTVAAMQNYLYQPDLF